MGQTQMNVLVLTVLGAIFTLGLGIAIQSPYFMLFGGCIALAGYFITSRNNGQHISE
jgi:hypothetical protein